MIAIAAVSSSVSTDPGPPGGGGIGIDLIEIDRIEGALDRRPRLAERLFTAREIALASSRARPARHLAARFAAKEAVIKALGAPAGVAPGQIEVLGSEPPAVSLSGRAAEEAARLGVGVTISLTHSRQTAAAVALLTPG